MDKVNKGRYLSVRHLKTAQFDLLKYEVNLVIETFTRTYGHPPKSLFIRATDEVNVDPGMGHVNA